MSSKENGILSQVHYMPVTSHPYYEKLGYRLQSFPEASSYYEEALSIPLYYSLTNLEQEKVIDTIKKIIKKRLSSNCSSADGSTRLPKK